MPIIIKRASSLRDGGYIVSLSGRCLETIKEMNLQTPLDTISYSFNENTMYDRNGNELLRIRYQDVHGGMPVRRNDLANLLAKALPDTIIIRFNSSLEHIVDTGSKIKTTLKSGEIIDADLLIGADGIRSSVRDLFWSGADCLENIGYSYAVYDVEKIQEVKSDAISFFSPGHLNTLYTLRNDRLAVLHIWRDELVESQDPQQKFKSLRRVTAGDVKQVAEVIDLAEEAGTSPMMDTLSLVNLSTWSQGRVLLLGDAAHCLTLMSSQGAGMALISAEILGKELIAAKDVSQALANHEKKLRPIIERLQSHSRTLAAAYLPKNIFMYYLRNFFLKFMPYSWVVSWIVSHASAELTLL